jgi:hypothetical protein
MSTTTITITTITITTITITTITIATYTIPSIGYFTVRLFFHQLYITPPNQQSLISRNQLAPTVTTVTTTREA